MNITIATRASNLALWQAYHIKDRIEKSFPNVTVSLNKITSQGDKILDKPEDEMLAGNADLAVHSLKDVPTYIPDGLELVAITQREDQSDVYLSHKFNSLDDLPSGAVVGTTSLRRRMQILQKRPDLKVKDLRGNVNTRLRKLSEGQYDAIILAYIGLARLDLLKDIPFIQKLSFMIPPMGQAALGIEIVSGDEKIREIAMSLNDESSYICSRLERDFVSKIGAGCSAPVAVNATIEGEDITIEAMLGYPDGTNILYKKLTNRVSSCQRLGDELAQEMIDDGALDILSKAEEIAFKDEMPERL